MTNDERIALITAQQHSLEREHYANTLNLRAATELSDLQGAGEQAVLAARNLEAIERKLDLLRSERSRLEATDR